MSNRLNSRVVGCAVMLLTCASFVRADTLLVPSEYATIQAAIDAAMEGDEVVIADGTYTGEGNRDISFLGKAITVRSASGDPALCIIDCQGAGRGFVFTSGESLDSVLSGMTIFDGQYIQDSEFACPASGGGVFIEGSAATISNCVFIDCVAFSDECSSGYGGAIAVENGAAAIDECRFIDCSARGYCTGRGGALSIQDSQVDISGCHFENNRASAITCAGVGYAYGGAIYCNGLSQVSIQSCRILGNEASATDSIGGAIFVDDAVVDLVNSLLFDNLASGGGGKFGGGFVGPGMFVTDGDLNMTNCTVYGNIGSIDEHLSSTAGIYVGPSGTATIANSIIYGPDVDLGQIAVASDATVVVSYSDVAGGFPGEGNIDVDPLFLNPLAGLFRPLCGSPVIDAGSNAAVPAGVLTDILGNPRFVDDVETLDSGLGRAPIVDLGAVEYAFTDCNGNAVSDLCDIALRFSVDCNLNAVPDECDIESGDCNKNGVPDECDLATGESTDCNENGVLDECEIASGTSEDCNDNGILDVCEITIPAPGITADKVPLLAPEHPHSIFFSEVPPANLDVVISVESFADLNSQEEYITITIEDTIVGNVFQFGSFHNCAHSASTDSLVVNQELFNELLRDDGELHMELTPSVGTICLSSYAIVTLTGWSLYDTDGDGVLDECQCPADLDVSGDVGFSDLLLLLGAWNSDDAAADLDGSGSVGFADLLLLLDLWGPCA